MRERKRVDRWDIHRRERRRDGRERKRECDRDSAA